MSNTQTYQMRGGIGLARMALVLSCNRIYNFTPVPGANVLARRDSAACEGSASFEYYAILDRISRGEKP